MVKVNTCSESKMMMMYGEERRLHDCPSWSRVPAQVDGRTVRAILVQEAPNMMAKCAVCRPFNISHIM